MWKVYDDNNANDNDDKTYIPIYPAKVNKSNLFILTDDKKTKLWVLL